MKFILVLLIVAGFVCVIMSFLCCLPNIFLLFGIGKNGRFGKNVGVVMLLAMKTRSVLNLVKKHFAQNIIGWTTKTIMRLFLLAMVKKNPPYLKIQVPTNACFQVITNPTPTNLH